MDSKKTVVNCEAYAIKHLFDEAAAWEARGNSVQAEKVLQAARAALEASNVTDPYAEAVMVVPLTDAELKQQAQDEKELAARDAVARKADADRAALVSRLRSGDATAEEVQQALAQLLA